jgi:hypothetical protein
VKAIEELRDAVDRLALATLQPPSAAALFELEMQRRAFRERQQEET